MRDEDDHHGEASKLTALMQASVNADLRKIEKLLSRGANIDFVNEASETALTYAIVWNQLDAARLLLEKGAEPEMPPAPSWSPLMYAANEGNSDLVNLLLRYGANRERRDEHRRTASTIADERGFPSLARLIEQA